MSMAKIEAAACQCCCKQQIETDKSKMLASCFHTLILCVQVTIRRRPFGTCAVPANKYSHPMLIILATIHGSDVARKKRKEKKNVNSAKYECLKGQNQFWNLIEASCKFEQAARKVCWSNKNSWKTCRTVSRQ